MKSSMIPAPTQPAYPCLKSILSDCEGLLATVVLFNSPGTGLVVYSENKVYPLGYFSTEWKENNFKDYKSQILLEF